MIQILSNVIDTSYPLKVSILAYTLSFAAILYVFVYKWRSREYFKKLEQITSLPTLPLIGSIHLILTNFEDDTYAHGPPVKWNQYEGMKLRDRVEKLLHGLEEHRYKKSFIFWFSYFPFVCLTQYEDIQIVSNKSIHRNSLGLFQNIIDKGGIAISPPDTWRKTRRLLNPAFIPNMLKRYLKIFNEHSNALVENLKIEAGSRKTFDVWPYIIRTNLNSATENVCGLKLKIENNESNEFEKALTDFLMLESARFMNPWLFPTIIFKTYLFFSGKKKVYNTLSTFASKIIKTKIEEYNKISENQNIADSDKTLLDVLLRVRETNPDVTEKYLQSELITMIGTGSESSAVVTSFLLLMFAIHQDAQEKAYQEIESIFGNLNRPVSMENLNELKYLEQCIKETLRRFTLVPIMFRKATEDILLSDKKIIPKDTMVALLFHAVHSDPDLFSDPNAWNPDNFALEKSENHNFIPFGTGPRACIGSKYAMASMKTQAVYILSNYRLFTTLTMNDIKLTLDLIFRNNSGYPIQIAHREKKNENYMLL